MDNSVELQEEERRSPSPAACSSPLEPHSEAYDYCPDE